MDPNVHQMTSLNRNQALNDEFDEDGDEYPLRQTKSSNVASQQAVIVKMGGMEPKVEMKKKIARQTDLIQSLERGEMRRSNEVLELKRKLREQDELIGQIK